MMVEITNNINWLAVIAGTFVSFLLGWLWYSPILFGLKWAEGVGLKLDGSEPSVVDSIPGYFVVGVDNWPDRDYRRITDCRTNHFDDC